MAMVHRTLQNISRGLLWLHRRLLPANSGVGWLPYLWLVWTGFFFIPWAFPSTSLATKVATLIAFGLFLPLYFRGYWARGTERYLIIAAIMLLAIALIPFNFSGGGLVIYAGSFVAWGLRPRLAIPVVACLATVAAAEYIWLGAPPIQWFWAPAITMIIGLANIWSAEQERQNHALRLSQAEVRRLAATAERERIARDLHDLLGHTLTLITVKAELAAKLSERNLPEAAREIRELEHVARDALAQVRQAVGGYRAGGLAGEIANARVALQTAGIEFDVKVVGIDDAAAQDAVLAMIVREAVTNVVRHAHARRCRLSLQREGLQLVLEISDDGRGGRRGEGHGIRGMRERVHTVGGGLTVEFDAQGGRLRATIPDTTTGAHVISRKVAEQDGSGGTECVA